MHARLGHVLHDLARHRADVRAAVTADFRFIAHATQGHTHELAVGGARDALPQRGLADTRRPHQTKNRSAQLLDPLLYSEVLDDALFDLIEPVVILVQDLLGPGNVLDDLGPLLPRHLHEPIDVIAHDGRFR